MRSLTLFTFLLLTGGALLAKLPATFNAQDQHKAPDYANPACWSALPFRHDAADIIPGNEQWVDDSLKQVDVFYIYPTVYRGTDGWNSDVYNEKQNEVVDKKPVKYQASVFNATCRVYAPRYRQACIQSFWDKENGAKALEFAYADVKKAFEYYLAHYNNGRPIIIASHSQGTHHARRLIKEFFDGTPLANRLVAAYVIGYGFENGQYTKLTPCNNATENGCYITWASFKEGYEPGPSGLYGNVCVNPITWTRDTIAVDHSKSIAALMLSFNKSYPHACGAQIHNGFLWVDAHLPVIRSWKNLHIADYNLFWFDIRKNVKDRVDAYFKKSS